MQKYDDKFINEIFKDLSVVHIAVNRNGEVIGTTNDWICCLNISGTWCRNYESDKLHFGKVDLTNINWTTTKRTNERAMAQINLLCLNDNLDSVLDRLVHLRIEIKRNKKILKG
jgi:hypothetical protein